MSIGVRLGNGANLGIALAILLLFVTAIGAPSVRAEEVGQTANCVPSSARVTSAYRVSRGALPPEVGQQGEKEVQLGDVVELRVEGLQAFAECAAKNEKSLRLFLDGQPLALEPDPPTDPSKGTIKYRLKVTDASANAWKLILGRPSLFSTKPIRLSVGIDYAIDAGDNTKLLLRVVPRVWFAIWLIILTALVALFWWCARNTSILRDGRSMSPTGDPTGLYSLARTQAAWWFFFILVSYLLIGLTTGDFTTSINATALTLLAIGGGTAAASSAIAATKDTEEAKDKEAASLEAVEQEMTQLKGQRGNLRNQLRAAGAPPPGSTQRLSLLQQMSTTAAKLAAARSQRSKLLGESENFVRDIISDANGASFHRFQMVAWTVILSFVFIRQVYENLAMPDFSPELLGLQGLSAATYLGLKTTEAMVPTKN